MNWLALQLTATPVINDRLNQGVSPSRGSAAIPYDRYTLFPFVLVEETVSILLNRGVKFECFGHRHITAQQCQSILQYLREYGAYKTGSRNLLLAVTATALNRLARKDHRLLGLTRLLAWSRPRSPTVVFHHDADRQPIKTVEMMFLEARLGVVSSNYFFVKRCPRWTNDKEAYELDFTQLNELQQMGFEIGYHSNAMEQADYDSVSAVEIANRDIDFLRSHGLNIRSFVPHGGQPGPGGLNNDHVPYVGRLSELVCSYNGRAFVNDLIWSDGYAEGDSAAELADPRKSATLLTGRMRGHFLMHPQYYGHTLRPDWETLAISRQKWWRKLWGL